MKKNKKEILILSILIIMFSIMITPKTLQNDTFFAIAGGKRVIEYGLEEVDRLTWHENLKFTNDRYIFDIIITLAYNLFNFFGVYIVVAIFSVIIGLVFYYLLLKRNINYILSFFSTIFVMYMGKGIIAARAQIVSILIFIIEVYCIEKLLETNSKRYFISLIILPLILANTHASIFLVYFIFFLPYIAEAILYKMAFVKNDGDKIYIKKRKNIKSLIIIMILGILCGLCTPIGEAPFTSMIKASKGISADIISELQPIVVIDSIEFMSLNIIFIAILAFTKTKINIADLFMFLGLDLMAMSTTRTIFYFIFIASIVATRLINEFLKENNVYEISISKKNKIIIYSILCVIFTLLLTQKITENLRKEYIDLATYPVEASEYIIDNLDLENIKIYNGFNYGSYLEFRGIKSFIDSRSGMFCEEFNEGVTILEDFNKIFSGTFKYNQIFEKYGITHVLLYVNELLSEYMKQDSKWNEIYQDDCFVIFEKVNN